MSPDLGGVFDVLSSLTRLGLGGPVAGGQQYVSWIHDHDFVLVHIGEIDVSLDDRATLEPQRDRCLAIAAILLSRARGASECDSWSAIMKIVAHQ